MLIHSDSPAITDLLNRKPFAEQIAHQIVTSLSNGHESIILGVNGTWGSGKSTFLSYIREGIQVELEETELKYLIYQFNPWAYSGQDALHREFLEGLLLLLSDTFKTEEKWKSFIKDSLKYIKFLKHVPGYGESIDTILDKITNVVEQDASLKSIKSKVDALLTEEEHRLFIFIDDIDRLLPIETLDIFKLVKLNANFKNTVFVIAYDRVVVEYALHHQYGASSSRYLEKIIQVDFKIPEILPELAQKLFLGEIERVFNQLQIEYNEDNYAKIWKSAQLYQIFRGLRDIYRLTNAISFTLPFVKNEVNISDFVLVEIIRIFDIEGYEKLYKNITQTRKGYSTGSEHKQTNEYNNKIRTIVNVLCSSNDGTPIQRGKGKHFSDFSYSDRYFALQISSYDISESEFELFLISNDKLDILKNIASGNRLNDFLNKLESLPQKKSSKEVGYFHIFNSVLDLFENDQLLRQYSDLTYMSIARGFSFVEDYHEIGTTLIECLTYNVSRLSISRYVFTYLLLEDIAQKSTSYSEKAMLLLESKRSMLEESQQQYHEKWYSYVMGEKVWEKPGFGYDLFFDYYAKNMQSDYMSSMDRILNNNKCIVTICKLTAMFVDNEGRPRRINSKWFKDLLPTPLDIQFQKRLTDVYQTLPSGRDKLLVEFFVNTLDLESSSQNS